MIITKEEFFHIMKDMVHKSISGDEIIEKIVKEFKITGSSKVDISKDQLTQVFKNLGIKLSLRDIE